MAVAVHHQPVNPSKSCTLHAWIGSKSWDFPGTRRGSAVDYRLPEVGDPRLLQFQFFSTDAQSRVEWEPDSFIRRLRLTTPAEIWTFEQSARVLYRDPTPAGAGFQAGDTLTFHAITRNRFNGGRLYAWNPYVPGGFEHDLRPVVAGRPGLDLRRAARAVDDGRIPLQADRPRCRG